MTTSNWRSIPDVSKRLRRTYSITVGLRAGYDPDDQMVNYRRTLVPDLVRDWILGRARNGKPFLTWVVTDATLVYGWGSTEKDAGSITEPAAVLSGEVSTLYGDSVSDEAVREMLEFLAAKLGTGLDQHRVYISYHGNSLDGESWVLENTADGVASPRDRAPSA
jgi:hypothetical protein